MATDNQDMTKQDVTCPFGTCPDCQWPRKEDGSCDCGVVKDFLDDVPTAVVELETAPGMVSWEKMAKLMTGDAHVQPASQR